MQKATSATAAKLATSLAAIVLAGCGAGASASTFSHKDRFAPAASASNTFVYSWVQRLDAQAPRILRSGYACAVMPPPGSRLVLFVTRPAAIATARRLLSKDRIAPAVVKVGYADRAYAKLQRIIPKLLLGEPSVSGAGSGALVDFSTPSSSACPRVEIDLQPKPTVNQKLARWAEAAVRRYGKNRVVIRHGLVSGPAATITRG